MDGQRVLGRDHEQRAIHEALDAARSGMSSALVLRGGAGMGKSLLLDAACRSAPDFQHAIMVGIEAESGFPYAGLHRLVAGRLDHAREIPRRQREALDVALGRASGDSGDWFLVGHAVLSLLSAHAAEQPLLCVVDDAHWIDQETLAVLAFVARRVHADSLAMLFGVRDPSGISPVLDDLPTVDVAPLSLPHVRALVHASAATPVDTVVAEHIAAAADGCPLAVVEASRSLSPEQLSGAAGLPRHLPMAPRLETHFLRQVRALPTTTQSLLLLAAAESAHDDHSVQRAADHLGLELAALDAAIDAGLVHEHRPLRFRHPLIRSAVYRGARNADRRRVHEALAAVLDPAAHLDRHALHRAAASPGPDEAVATLLDRAAAVAADRGGPASVTSLCTRAAELTPSPWDRARRLLDAAEAALTAGLPQRSAALLAEVDAALDLPVAEVDDPVLRARAERVAAGLWSLTVPGDVAAVHLRSAAALGSLDPDLARDTYAEALQAALISAQYTRGTTLAEVARALRAAPVRPGGPTVVDLVVDGLSTRLTEGAPEAGPKLHAAADAVLVGDLTSSGRTLWAVTGQIAILELWDAERHRRFLDRITVGQRRRGELDGLRISLLGLVRAETWAGRFGIAEGYMSEANEVSLAIEGPGPAAEIWAASNVELLAWQGREADTRAVVDFLTNGFCEAIGAGAAVNVAWLAVLILGLAQGDVPAALDAARTLFADDVPADGTLALPDIVESAVRGGDVELAHAALDRMSGRAVAGGTQWGLGLLARSRALVDLDGAEAHHLEAVERLDRSGVATDAARARLLHGEWLRRRGRRDDAREALRAAYSAFSDMGASAFAERARVELEASGERTIRRSAAAPGDLTPQESQVARLAAAGDTNAEIAERLYISASTVDYHLRKVFRKLGITSRRELRRRFD